MKELLGYLNSKLKGTPIKDVYVIGDDVPKYRLHKHGDGGGQW